MSSQYEIVLTATDSKGDTKQSEPLNMEATNAPNVEAAVKVAEGILVASPNGGAAKITRAQETER